jgi:tRNA(Ile)-lysidine synthase
LRSEPRGIRLRLYRRAILQAKGNLARIGFRHLRAIDCLVFSAKPHLTLDLPDRLRATKSYGEISFSAGEDKKPLFSGEIYLDGPGIYPLPGSGMLAVDYADVTGDLKSAPATTAYFDLDRAPFPWRVRTFRPGDRFSPFGMTGQKKVKELFIDAKVPLSFRRRIPILFCGETLLWVGGIRRSNAASLTTGTKTVARVEILDFTP